MDFTNAVFASDGLEGCDVAEARYNRGLSNYHLELWRDAINDFSKAIDSDPNRFEFFEMRAESYLRRSDFDAAESDFEEALEISGAARFNEKIKLCRQNANR